MSTDGDAADGDARVGDALELDVLRARVRDLERFVSRLGHELATPLATISGFSSMLARDDTLDEATNDALRRIRSSSERAGRTLRGIVDETRLDRAESTAITDLLDDAVREVGLQLGTIDLDRPASPSRVFCVRSVGRRLMVAAVEVHAARVSTPLRLRAIIVEAARGDTVAVRLESDGRALRDEERHALERAMAFDVDTGGDVGLDAIVRAARLAATQGGRVWLGDGEDGGITLTVSLPRSNAFDGVRH